MIMGMVGIFFLFFVVNMLMVMGMVFVVGVLFLLVSWGGLFMLVLMMVFGIV